MGIVKKWTVFALEEAVYGFSNSGVEHDDFSFTLNKRHTDTEEGCQQYIENHLRDCYQRGFSNIRMVILPVFVTENDKIF